MEIPLLTSGESKVYQALIELGESSIGNILKISGVSHSKIYDILERLANKGLVSSINKNGKQYFLASSPSRLNGLIEEERFKIKAYEEKIKQIIPKLENRKSITNPKSVLSAYEGIKGMKTVLEYVLSNVKKKEEILIMGSPKKIGESFGGYIKEWQKKRINIGAICKIISDYDAPSWDYSWWKESKKKKLTFTKRSKSSSPSYLVITQDLVVTIYFSEKILSFVVEQKDVADRYRKFFKELWKS